MTRDTWIPRGFQHLGGSEFTEAFHPCTAFFDLDFLLHFQLGFRLGVQEHPETQARRQGELPTWDLDVEFSDLMMGLPSESLPHSNFASGWKKHLCMGASKREASEIIRVRFT